MGQTKTVERDKTTLATKDQFLAALPVRETDLVRYGTADGWIVEVVETCTIELARSDKAIRRQ